MKHTQNIVVVGVAAIALLVSGASMVSAYSQSKKVAHLESLVDSMNVALAKVKPWAISPTELEKTVTEFESIKKIQASPAPATTSKSTTDTTTRERRYGDKNAQFTIVEFSDFECPYCKDFYPVPRTLVDGSRGNISLIFKHVPIHGDASRKESLAAECAAGQGGNDAFFRMSDTMFANTQGNGQGTTRALSVLADEVGLDGRELSRCIDDGDFLPKVRADFKEAIDGGLKQTPTILIKHNPTGKQVMLEGAKTPEDIMRAMGTLVSEQKVQQ